MRGLSSQRSNEINPSSSNHISAILIPNPEIDSLDTTPALLPCLRVSVVFPAAPLDQKCLNALLHLPQLFTKCLFPLYVDHAHFLLQVVCQPLLFIASHIGHLRLHSSGVFASLQALRLNKAHIHRHHAALDLVQQTQKIRLTLDEL